MSQVGCKDLIYLGSFQQVELELLSEHFNHIAVAAFSRDVQRMSVQLKQYASYFKRAQGIYNLLYIS